jgi:hypothetical protein
MYQDYNGLLELTVQYLYTFDVYQDYNGLLELTV